MRDPNLSRARAAARRVLRAAGVTRPEHIDLDAIAHMHGAQIVVGPLDRATARLTRVGDRAVIRVSDRIGHEGARRFSAAHELGHLVLGHGLRASEDGHEWASGHWGRAATGAGRADEREANAFAAELTMPTALARARCEISPVDLAPARAIATVFRTSLVASAIRFAELASERCAVVLARDGRVQWVVPSATFRPTIASRVRLARASLAHDVAHARRGDEPAEAVPAAAWLDDAPDEEIVEHAIAIADLDAVLAMLWIPERVAHAFDGSGEASAG